MLLKKHRGGEKKYVLQFLQLFTVVYSYNERILIVMHSFKKSLMNEDIC